MGDRVVLLGASKGLRFEALTGQGQHETNQAHDMIERRLFVFYATDAE